MKVLILNGPNLNLVGKREPEIYGNQSFDEFIPIIRKSFADWEIQYEQTNHEGILIDLLQQAESRFDAVILNPGGYSHTSVALADAIRSISVPVLEVHLSNIHAREPYRQHSMTASACRGIISGFGLQSYVLALQSVRK